MSLLNQKIFILLVIYYLYHLGFQLLIYKYKSVKEWSLMVTNYTLMPTFMCRRSCGEFYCMFSHQEKSRCIYKFCSVEVVCS